MEKYTDLIKKQSKSMLQKNMNQIHAVESKYLDISYSSFEKG